MDFLRNHQGLIAAEPDAPRPLLPPAKIAGAIPPPMNLPCFVILPNTDRASPRREGPSMMKGAGQLTGAAAVTTLRIPVDLHSEVDFFLLFSFIIFNSSGAST
jgi:hypothetical protein